MDTDNGQQFIKVSEQSDRRAHAAAFFSSHVPILTLRLKATRTLCPHPREGSGKCAAIAEAGLS